MNSFIDAIEKIQYSADGPFDSFMIINKDGIIEYIKIINKTINIDSTQFFNEIIGKHILDAYPFLTEETSTVMRTLLTGTINKVERQSLYASNIEAVISSVTYPIFDENHNIHGAIDATCVVDLAEKANDMCSQDLSILDTIITTNVEMIKLKKFIANVAIHDSPVFIYGETGTGKELVAQALHALSPRKHKPFISQNCAAIPNNLLESTFFGTEKGGFTGAEVKQGLFEMADGGTLFLDEINSMNTAMQAKLLKVLEEQRVRKIGGETDISFNVRIICASNDYAAALLKCGKLREDFYYRISVVKINLPPLRERRSDIMPLTEHFIKHYNKKMGKNIQGISHLVEEIFMSWNWPGNIRELKGVIENAYNIETSHTITLNSIADLIYKIENSYVKSAPEPCQSDTPMKTEKDFFSISSVGERLKNENIDLTALLYDYERCVIQQALRQNRKLNVVAEKLSVSPQKLNYRMSKLKLK